MDFYGRFLASCSSDSSVKIFEISQDNQNLIADLRELTLLISYLFSISLDIKDLCGKSVGAIRNLEIY